MNRFRHNERLASSSTFRVAVIVLVAVSLPLFFISWNVRVLTNSQTFYEWGFDNYNVERRTGLEGTELNSAAAQIIDYFNNDEELLDVRVNFQGTEFELFNQREIIHMRDVKELMNAVFLVGWVTSVLLVVLIVTGFFTVGRRFLPLLRSGIIWSTIGGLVIAAFVGLASLIDFNTTFRIFHEISFRNDFWMLSPSQSMLLRMFPQGFWLIATMILVVVSAIELGVVYGGATWGLRRFGRSGTRGRTHPAPALDSDAVVEPTI
ncbi:MAG: TIGR01906 family membrane protein [Chloroflexi bacterium]|nr:TIGR01906 family membrane protein [Chloroflexota bacterium]